MPAPSEDALTFLSHLGEEEKVLGAVVPPIVQTSTFTFERTEDLLRALEQEPLGPPHHYSRCSNPTVDAVAAKVSALERAEDTALLGSGMAALSTAIFATVRAGSHIVLPDTTYGPVRQFVERPLARFGVTHTYVSGGCVEEFMDAVTPETALIYLESPSSLLFRLQDVPAIAAFARSRGIATIMDNTYFTPLGFRALEHGVDLVCHSATKYMGGHSDLTAGTISGSEERVARIRRGEAPWLGSVLHPFPAFLLNRGLRTLPLRLPVHTQSANRLAAFLAQRPEVARVHHVGHPDHPQADLARKLGHSGTGIFSFEPKTQDRAKVLAFCDRLRWFGRGISWGGHESLVVPAHVKPQDWPEARWVVRLYCGLESADTLLQDVEDALPALA